jgi:hypothetical protein
MDETVQLDGAQGISTAMKILAEQAYWEGLKQGISAASQIALARFKNDLLSAAKQPTVSPGRAACTTDRPNGQSHAGGDNESRPNGTAPPLPL